MSGLGKAMRLAEGHDVARDPVEAYYWITVGTEGFGQGLWDVKREEYRAKVPASQRKATEDTAQKFVQRTQAHR